MQNPILFLIFNRPVLTARVFEAIRATQPPRLYIAADGPRSDRKDESTECEAAREVATRVDWPCEVKTLFQSRNLGPMHAQIAAFNWFFSEETQGVVLEDDCLPEQEFFPYCDELLERYKDDQRVFMVSGNNFQDGIERGPADYYFSSYIHIWGWAAWRRTWQSFDQHISEWPQFRDQGGIENLDDNVLVRRFWNRLFDSIYSGRYDRGWDYRLSFACWRENGVVATPQVNLVTNIGFGDAGTNCIDPDSPMANMPTGKLGRSIAHPSIIARNRGADKYTAAKMFSSEARLTYLSRAIRHPKRSVVKLKAIFSSHKVKQILR